ncbi:unnamed protein product [Allacma fusca]|uniref:Integrase catalytic domain-containing protein n=1 Tax=Allacma fusca TaxID=39272 RepID=A0A8J2PH08_9HEXA|nr:unnamed protein product [Allacma fusca]
MHLEMVSDLTSEAFISCLHRFVFRRGKPTEIFSDNGSNFVGADRELKEFLQLIASNETNTRITQELLKDGIKLNSNPPTEPHMGGIWEAGIKSVKCHLERIMGNNSFTFEELTTFVT